MRQKTLICCVLKNINLHGLETPQNGDCDEVGDDDDDLYIIGAVCLSVCQKKSLLLYSKDLGASHVYRHFLY